MPKKVTVRTIADLAGVSPSTVSRVLNNSGYASGEVEERVLSLGGELGYTRSTLARRGGAKLIALLMPKLQSTFDSLLAESITQAAAQEGYSVVLGVGHLDQNTLLSPPPALSSVAGVIAMNPYDCIFGPSRLVAPGTPVVQLCEYEEHLPWPHVSIDDFAAAYNVVQYLHSTGRRSIGIINTNRHRQCGQRREEGALAAMRDLGLEARPEWIVHLNRYDFKMAFSVAQSMLEGGSRPDAIFGFSDTYAVAAVRAAHRLGLSVPEDVSVAGFDNTELALLTEPGLTSVSQPLEEMGSIAAALLIDMVEGRSQTPRSFVLDTQLIVRGSTLRVR